jgi:8-oxo-dGTP pyrophosphatase MutT (NUDIX family)
VTVTPPAPPDDVAIPAATVVLARDGREGLEVLMVRRAARLAFAGGAWVFPGGRVDHADFPPGVRADDPDALLDAARAAAVREAAEEAGLAVDTDSLVWFSHWTPLAATARRFATYFFLAPAPAGSVVVDDGEITDHVWITPTEAMARRAAGEIEMVSPTWITLHSLTRFTDVDHARRELAAGEPSVYRTKIVEVEGGIATIWQGDAAYDDLDGARPGPRNRLVMVSDGWFLEQGD